MSLPLSGSTTETPLPELFEELRRRKATGTLTIRCNEVEKSVYVKDGQIIFAKSTDEQDRLGEMLVKAGTLSREHLEAALSLYKKSGGFKKLGAILVESHFVSPKDLFGALKTQVKDIIYSVFLLENAEYRFVEQLPADIIPLQIQIQDLLQEIIQRIKLEA